MNEFDNIRLTVKRPRADISLSRPGKHNALNPEMIEELHEALSVLERQEDILFVVFSGEGPSFCAGADLNWLAGSVIRERSQIRYEYERLAELLRRIVFYPKITLAAAHKHVIGGGNGLLAACDYTVAEETTTFAFSEVRLGVVPATIMPFVAKRVTIRDLRKLMFSGVRFAAREGHLIGLVDFIAAGNGRMKVVDELIKELGSVSPNALKACKQLILKVDSGEVGLQSGQYTASVLADLIHTGESREGIQAFLEKRKPDWIHQK